MVKLRLTLIFFLCFFVQGQPPPEGREGEKEGERTEDRKQKENTAYAKKMVLRLAGLMGVGGAVGIVYIFGEHMDVVPWPERISICVLFGIKNNYSCFNLSGYF